MKKKYLALALTAFLCSHSYAQDSNAKEIDDKYVENDVVSLAGKKGFSFSTKAGDFLFKPYALVQTSLSFNRYVLRRRGSKHENQLGKSGQHRKVGSERKIYRSFCV